MIISGHSSFNNQFGTNGESMRGALRLNANAADSDNVGGSTTTSSFLTLSSRAAGELLTVSRSALGGVLLNAFLRK